MQHIVSPGSRPRPSLSALDPERGPGILAGVAGVSAPAFVERSRISRRCGRSRRVAGVSAPAFVERSWSAVWIVTETAGVAGVSAPAFVERLQV